MLFVVQAAYQVEENGVILGPYMLSNLMIVFFCMCSIYQRVGIFSLLTCTNILHFSFVLDMLMCVHGT